MAFVIALGMFSLSVYAETDYEIHISTGVKSKGGNRTTSYGVTFETNDRTYTPIRFIAEKLNCTVEWNPEGQVITITK